MGKFTSPGYDGGSISLGLTRPQIRNPGQGSVADKPRTSSYTSLSVATLQDLANDPIAIDMHQNLGSVKYLSQAQQCVTDTEKSNSCGQLVKGLTKENFQQAYFYILRCKLADFIYKGPKVQKICTQSQGQNFGLLERS